MFNFTSINNSDFVTDNNHTYWKLYKSYMLTKQVKKINASLTNSV